MKRDTIVGTGLVTLDLIFRGDASVPVRRAAGGTCGNVLAILAYMGWRSVPVSRLDDDVAGELVEADLKTWGVDVRYLRLAPHAPTPIIVERIRHRRGQVVHSFLFTCPCCGAMLPRYRPIRLNEAAVILEKEKRPSVFFFDRVSPASVRMAHAYSEAGTLVMFEPSGIGDPDLFEEAVGAAHIVKYSEQRLGGIPTVRASKRRIEIQTRGADGLRYRISENKKAGAWIVLPALPATEVVDTAGAGDWCTAGLLSQVGGDDIETATSERVEKALRFGQALSAWNCRFEGARGGMYEHTFAAMKREITALLSGSALTSEPEHVELTSAKPPETLCPACERKPKGARRAL